jgi:Tfp pilus assembly protein FimT
MNRGVSALEILIAISIATALTIFVVSTFSGFKSNQELNSSVEIGISLLQDARSKTLSSKDASQYGVHFELGKAVLFKGTVYSAVDPNNDDVLISQNVEISGISLQGGGSEVIFKRLTGETDQYGTITFRLKSNTANTKIITVIATGIVI